MMKKRLIAALIGVVLIISSVAWQFFVLPKILETASEGGENGESGQNMTFMEGKIGIMRIFERKNISFFNITAEDFNLCWKNIVVRNDGLYDKNTNERLFDSGNGIGNESASKKKKFFPLFGVEKRDYKIWNDFIKNETSAKFVCEGEVKGKRVYIYSVKIDSYPLREENFWKGDIHSMGNISYFKHESPKIYYDEDSLYYIEPETSVPLNIDMRLNISVEMPDMTLLMVREGEKVTYSEGEVWVRNETFPFIYEKKEVLVEKHVISRIPDDAPEIAVFEKWNVYYDRQTGEKLSDEYQEEHEIFAVNRSTYMYVPYKNTNSKRKGYYTFPVGKVEKKSYPMWDEMADDMSYANYAGSENHSGRECYVYVMLTDNASVDSSNIFLPIYRHPGTEYRYSGSTTFFVDEKSGMIIDIITNGTFYVVSGGPLSLIQYPVATFNFSLNETTVENMTKIASFFSKVILPISSKRLTAFSAHIYFTEEFTESMISIANDVSRILLVLRVCIPSAMLIPGIVITSIAAYMLRRKKSGV